MSKGIPMEDSDMQSENPDDFLSDHEPPKDTVRERKVLQKSKHIRIYKEIWQVGVELSKPAKYDEVNVRFQQMPDIDDSANYIQPVSQDSVNKFVSDVRMQTAVMANLGTDKFSEWQEIAIESMKQGEISFYVLEFVQQEKDGQKMLMDKQFHLVWLESWITVVDLRQDMTILKKVLSKGSGNHRPEKCDEVIVNYSLHYRDTVIEERNSKEPVIIENLINQGNSQVICRVLFSMKEQEKAICQIKYSALFELESEEWKLQNIIDLKATSDSYQNKEGENQLFEGDYQLQINLERLIRIDDIFGDGCALKREIKKGNSTAKPDKMSEIYFDLRIVNTQGERVLYESLTRNFFETNEYCYLEDCEMLNSAEGPWKQKLDEYKISKFLKNTLRRMKKNEYATVVCRDKKLIKYGRDYEEILFAGLVEIPDTITYHIRLYNFTDGKNTFSMSIDEKIEQAKRKKEVGLHFIEIKNFKKARKTFEAINGFFELGQFIGDDIQKIFPHKLSSLLNTSLCYLKTQQWKKLMTSCEKILEMDPQNSKAIFRKALALRENSDFNQAIQLIQLHFQSTNLTSLSPSFRIELQKLLDELVKLQSDYLAKQKRIFSKLFD